MKKLPISFLSLCLFLTVENICFGVVLETNEGSSFQPSEWMAVSDEGLDSMRGGFDAGTGLTVSFGIVRTITINGDLISRTSFNLPDVTKITAEQAQIASAAMTQAGIIQNGANNFVEPGVKSQLATGTVIQNTLNDQRIESQTVINAGVNSLGLLKSINTQTILKDALLGSLGFH